LKIEQFLACLVTRPAFQQRVTNIVTEWASSGQQSLIVGRIGELRAEERSYLAAIGDPNQAFFAEAQRFPTNVPLPQSLRIRNEETSKNLADSMDAFVFLGPEPDKSLIGAIPLTAQQRELARRNAITSD
jgi:hypothetical protein